MILNTLIDKGQYVAAYVAARYCYRMGLPTLTDEEYDKLELWVKENEADACKEYLERSYDDDPIPTKLLEVLGIEIIIPEVSEELYKYLDDEKSNSIRAIHSMEEVFEFVNANRGKEIMFSLKLDGVNKKVLYKDGEYKLSLSRGRGGNSLNYTNGSKHVVKMNIDAPGIVKMTGECFVTPAALTKLREKYNAEKYKTSKSAAISMLRVEHDVADYEDLNVLMFNCEGKHFDSVSSMYEYLEKIGYNTPPHFLIQEFPEKFSDFKNFIERDVLDRMFLSAEGFPSDGVVMEVNDLTSIYSEENQYSSRQVAIKFGHWGFECLKGIITDIIIEQQRVYKSVRIKIEPIKSADGCSAEFINGFNPSILIENDLKIGTEVFFERNSGAVNILIHGKKLEGLKSGGD